jgi:UDP-N-acetylmuramoylalanine--D-glutamate ligase
MEPKQVTILGLGLFGGGAGAARYYAERSARVIVTDLRDEAALVEAIDGLRDLPISYRLGEHREEDFAGSGVVVVNPAVPPWAPALELARRAGAKLETATNLFFRLCPAPIVAVTGTHGKSTTVAMLASMIRASGRRAWLGGNLGGSLLPQLEAISPNDVAVLEISSFQAQRLAWIRKSPQVAAVLNLAPNHLDRHADMAEYAAAKQELLRYQGATDFALLNASDPIVSTWGDVGCGSKLFVGADASAERGVTFEGARTKVWQGNEMIEFGLDGLRLPGAHNRFNAACAGALAWLLGADVCAIERAIREFEGLPERLEFVREIDGVRFYNDSIATTPDAAMCGINAFEAPVVLIAGGSSKHHSFDALADIIAEKCKCILLVGAAANDIAASLARLGDAAPPVTRVRDFRRAVLAAAATAIAGDVVLLSPACASFDMFRNYRERGRKFVALVKGL